MGIVESVLPMNVMLLIQQQIHLFILRHCLDFCKNNIFFGVSYIFCISLFDFMCPIIFADKNSLWDVITIYYKAFRWLFLSF